MHVQLTMGTVRVVMVTRLGDVSTPTTRTTPTTDTTPVVTGGYKESPQRFPEVGGSVGEHETGNQGDGRSTDTECDRGNDREVERVGTSKEKTRRTERQVGTQ